MDSKIKALFFAQYLNQKVYQHDDWKDFNDKSCKELDPTYLQTGSNRLNGGYLVLRDISQLTIQELDLISQVYVGDDGFKLLGESDKQDYREEIKPALINCLESGLMRNSIWDILRSIGIALPFTFLNETNQPETYSVEKLIELGWAKINQKP